MATYGYARVSTSDQANGSSLDDQERVIGAVATLRRVTLDRLFTDQGVSGSVPLEQRPQGAELVALLRPGDGLIVAKLDRCFRSAGDAITTAERWKREGIDLIVCDIGLEPVTGNGTAKMFFGLLALVAEFERARLLERIEDGRQAKRARGGHIGGLREFGYQVVGRGRDALRVPDVREQKAIARMQRLRAKGLSLRAISAELAKTGHVISYRGVARALARRA